MFLAPPRWAPAVHRNLIRFLQLASACPLLLLPLGCDAEHRPTPSRTDARQPLPQPDLPTAGSAPDNLGPTETVERLRDYRFTGRYSLIEPFLLPEQRSAVIAQIRAVDRLHAAAKMLRRRVRHRLGMAAAQEFDFRQVANLLGVFSPDVTLLTERIDVDRATVSFQVADRIPLDAAEMLRRENHWVLVSDPIDGVPDELLKLALLLERIADQVNGNDLTVDELRREIKLRQAPILRRLKKLVTSATPRTPLEEPKTGPR